MKSNQELIQEAVGELEVAKNLEVFDRCKGENVKEYYCMDCRIGNVEDGREAICEACAYL